MNFKKKAAAAAAAAKHESTEEFLEHKRKKRWIDKKSGYNRFMLYPTSPYGCHWSNRQYWDWRCFKETSDENIEVVKLICVCWLDESGAFRISDLLPGVLYELVYVVKVTNAAYGWEAPIILKLTLPNGRVQNRQVSLLEEPRGQWIELSVGNFLIDQSIYGSSSSSSETADCRPLQIWSYN